MLQSLNVDAGELQEMSLMKLAEEIHHKTMELNQRYGVLNGFKYIYSEDFSNTFTSVHIIE